MPDGNRPVGRRKRVGSGGGGVFRRGSGLGRRTGGPVGDAGGYADRPTAPGWGPFDAGSGGGSERAGGGLPSGLPTGPGCAAPQGGCLKLLIILIVVAVGLYLLSSLLGGGLGDFSGVPGPGTGTGGGAQGFQSAASQAATTYLDEGAYPVDTSVSERARDKRTVLRGNGDDTVTVMLYVCATDLESQGGMATADLNEILHAEIAPNVNIIVETGGTKQWRNSVISSTTNQRYQLTNKGLVPLDTNIGRRSMVDPRTLTDFIRFCESRYPADRYMLVLWDHGGGSITGYGYDEVFPGDSMTVEELGGALRNAGCTFDLVGFDACLMATLETAVALEPYADYLVASEETEPGIGWHYTEWVSALSRNTSIPTAELGKILIDDYLKEVQRATPRSQATLSLIDLGELKGTVPSALATFARATTALIDGDDFRRVSNARAGAKEFAASSRINQVDLVHLAENIGTTEARALADALRGCIKYNRTSTNIANANGVSAFFPYGGLTQVGTMMEAYDEIGMGDEYAECVRSFASVSAAGQVTSGGGGILDVLLGGQSGGAQAPSGGTDAVSALLQAFLSSGDFGAITGGPSSSAGWLDVDRMRASLGYLEEQRFDASALVLTERDGQRVLDLPDEQWGLVQSMAMNVFVDDGEGFIDLGLDNVFEYSAGGDLVMEYDGTWLALNGHIVSYQVTSEDRHGDAYTIRGRVPALLNDDVVDIIIVFDEGHPYGSVLGAQRRYDAERESGTVAKGLIDIVAGDTIDYLCDYYTYQGQYRDTYRLGEQYTATGNWEIENLPIGTDAYQMTYRLTDLYGNVYWTPPVSD